MSFILTELNNSVKLGLWWWSLWWWCWWVCSGRGSPVSGGSGWSGFTFYFTFTVFFYKIHDDDNDDDDDDAISMLCFSGNDVVLLQSTESEHHIINRTLRQLNTAVKC